MVHILNLGLLFLSTDNSSFFISISHGLPAVTHILRRMRVEMEKDEL
jgi:hypothetical protein